jgi:hypothetical protein
MGGGGKGKGSANRAKDYFGTIAGVVGLGPIDNLYAILIDGAEVWPRALVWASGESVALNALRSHTGRTWKCILAHTSSTANAPPNATNWVEYSLARSGDFTALILPVYGRFVIYWGTTTQPADDQLNPTAWATGQSILVTWRRTHNDGIYTCKKAHTSAATSEPGVGATWTQYWGEKQVKHPPYRGVSYVVLDDFLLGRERSSAPNVEVIVGKKPTQTVITGTPANLNDGQANVAAAVADFLTTVDCLALANAGLNTTSFQNAADALEPKASLAACSPFIDSQESLRTFLQKAQEVADFWLRYNPASEKIEAGTWVHGATPVSFTTITANDLVDTPDLSADGWDAAKTRCNVEFRDRTRSYKQTSDAAPDLRALRVVGGNRPLNLQRPWITRRLQAVAHAAETLRTVGRPQLSGTIRVRREKGRAIRPGDWILLDIDLEPGGAAINQFFKVVSRTLPPYGAITFDIEADETIAPIAFTETVESVPENRPEIPDVTNHRIIEAPVAMADLKTDHVLVLAERNSDAVAGCEVFFDTVTGGSFQLIGSQRAFCCRATLRADYNSAASGALQITAIPQADIALLADTTSVLTADDDTLVAIVVKTASPYVAEDGDDYAEIEVMSISAVALVSGNDYDLTVLRERQGTKKRSFVTATTEVWIIYRDLLTAMRHGKFDDIRANRITGGTPATGFFRLASFTQNEGRDLADCASIEFRWPKSSPAGPSLTLTSPVASGSDYQWPPNWSSSTAYVIGNWVWQSGTAYRCILGHTNQTPPNGTYWVSGAPYPVDIHFAGTWTDPNGDLVAAQILVKKDGGLEVEDEGDTMAPTGVLAFSEDVNIAEDGTWRVRLVGTDASGLVTTRTITVTALGSTTQVAKPKFKWRGRKVKGTEWNLHGKLSIKCRTDGAAISYRYHIAEERNWATGTSYVVGDKRWHNGIVYTCYIAHTSGALTEPGVGANWTNNWKDASLAGSAWVTATNYIQGDKRTHGGFSFMSKTVHTSGASTEPGVGASWRGTWVYINADGSLDIGPWHAYDDTQEGYEFQPYGWQPTDNIREIIDAKATKASYTDSEIATLLIRFKRISNSDFAP